MTKHYLARVTKTILLAAMFAGIGLSAFAQTTLTTLPNPPYNGGNSLVTGSQISFVLNNTNGFPVLLTGLGQWCTTANNGTIWDLYYTATALSGPETNVTVAPWILVATSSATSATATGITPLTFPGLSFTIPAGTQYRFALRNTNQGSTFYSGTGTGLSPNSFTGGGVSLLTGDVQIAGANVGYSGTGTGLTLTPRHFTGSVTFAPAGPCTSPPVVGPLSSTASNACLNENFTLSTSGGTGGTGQTYQWQISTDNITFTNIAGATNATLTTSQTSTNYYRVIVTCGGQSVTSNSVIVTTAAAVGGTFTINSAVATGGTNFQSFNDAYNYIKCGLNAPVVFNVDPASGPYVEQLITTPVPGASAVNTVTFNGNGRTLSFTSSNTNERAVIKLNGTDHFKFDNLNIVATGTTTTQYGFGVQLLNDADSNAVTNSNIVITDASTSTNYAGIVMSNSATSAITSGNTLSDGNLFFNNNISGGYYGFTCVGSTTAANRDNIFRKNNVTDYYFYGTYLLGNFNTLIDSNVYSRPNRTIVSTHHGVFVTSLNIALRIDKNTFTNGFGGAPTSTSVYYAVFFTGVDALSGLENKVTNNKVFGMTGNGEHTAFNNTSSDNVWYQHNTVLLDGTGASTGTALTRGFFQTTAAAGIRLDNNIFDIRRASAGPKYCLHFGTITSDIVSNRNDLYFNTPSGNAFTGFYTTTQLSLANWQAASSQDANSVANPPLYEGFITGNLKPTNASIDNLGAPVGITNDILGIARSASTPDIGAYEFTPGNCVAPPEAGTAVVTPSTVCQSDVVSLAVTGNSVGLGQTYQWQSSTTIGGTYTNISGVLTNPVFSVTATTTLYYRLVVTCSGQTTFSVPALLTVNPSLPAGTYTINQAVVTGGTNYQNFAAVKQALTCGIAGPIVFNVVANSGPYLESFVLDQINGSSATNTVTFNGNGNTIKYSGAATDDRAVIKLRGTDHFIFDSLIIDATGPNAWGFGVQLLAGADSNVVNNCQIISDITSTSTNYTGISVSNLETSATATGNTDCDGNRFSNNTIKGGYYGITLVGGTTTTTTPINGNIVENNKFEDFYFYGIYLNGNTNVRVEANDISRPTRTTLTTFYGVYVAGLTTEAVVINRNKIHDPFTQNTSSTSIFYGIFLTGIDVNTGMETRIRNNAIYNVNGGGSIYGLYNSSSNNVKYYHNTVNFDDAAYSGTALAYNFYQITTADGIDIKNNIFSNTRGGTGNKVGIYRATATTTITSDYNNFYLTGTNRYVGFDGTLRVTLADWRASSGFDLNSLATNPFYQNASGGILAPFSAILDDKGTPLGVLVDINSTTRSTTTPDIGAWEFAVPPCTAPPTPGTTVATPNSGICIGAQIELSLVGNSVGSGQTYQLQSSAAAAGPWTNVGAPMQFPDTTVTASVSIFYRFVVTCTGVSANSVAAAVTLNPAFLAGTYTINKTIPASAVNFTSIASAVAALDCGITGPVFFDINADTYTEQIRMKFVGGTSPTVRVTFRSANGNPASVILTNAGTLANNYTLKLDSAQYITWKNITIVGTNTTYGRVVEFANTAAFDSIIGCTINAPIVTVNSTNTAAVFGTALKGGSNVIKNNSINNGAYGVYLLGTSTANLSYDNVIDSNLVNTFYSYGLYFGNLGRTSVVKNMVNMTMPANTINYGIYSTSSDSNYKYIGNQVNMTNMTVTSYGMYFTGCNGGVNLDARITNNTITAIGNTGSTYGLYQTASTNNKTRNNVISISTTGATAYGSFLTTGGGVKFQNNTIVNNSTTIGNNNAAAYFAQSSGLLPSVNIQNNIFSGLGGGRAMYTTNLNFMYSDYNTFYTTGPTLIQWNAGNQYATLQQWKDTSFWDFSSIAVLPSLISGTDLKPNLTDPNVWAIHGRGNQITDNDVDFNGQARPTTLTTGVPDMGAYEFLPTVPPSALVAIPALPAPGTTQRFMFGTDTVAQVTYRAGAPVPATMTLQRYSGVLPTGLASGQQSMYFYTDIAVPAQGAYSYDIKQFYVDSWRGFIPTEPTTKLGRTDASGTWVLNPGSTVDIAENFLKDTALTFIGKYTGLTDGSVPLPPIYSYPVDSSNSGTRFWVGYGHHYSFNTNAQDMVLYLSAQQPAVVTVSVNGTVYKKQYNIGSNSAIVSVPLPKSGLIDSRITDEGKFDRGISIESSTPIQAYAHIYDGANSGASLLLPTGVYGKEYQSLNYKQYYPTGGAGSYSWFMAIADRDSTLLEITPAVLTKAGRPAGVPFQVYLNRGEVYNVMGTINGAEGTDMSGSTVRSLPNAGGSCHPFAMFSGSSRNAICNTTNGDNFIQQVFPTQAWGRRYLSFATANSTSNTQYNSNIYRVLVKDVTTVVKRNGVTLNPATLQLPGKYYEFSTPQGAGAGSANYVEADKPVMLSQYMVSTGANQCPGVTATGSGDPEMIYISPIEQGIKDAVFYNTNENSITSNYVNVIVPTSALASLQIDGASTFTDVFAHPQLAGYTCVRQNFPSTPGQHRVVCDSAFSAITYGLGSVESYGYNAGTLVKNLNAIPSFANTLGTGAPAPYTCVKAPFQLSIRVGVKPTSILWQVSQVANLAPNMDTLQINPVPTDSSISNGQTFYTYTLGTIYTFSQPGTYNVPIEFTHPSVEGCSNRQETILTIQVLPAPRADFAGNNSVCLGQPASLTGSGTTSNGVLVNNFNWNFGDNTTGTGQSIMHTYLTAGTFNIKLNIIAQDGCIGDTTKQIIVDSLPIARVVADTVSVCNSAPATFTILNPVAGVTYSYYTTATGGTAISSGTTLTVNPVTGNATYYVGAVTAAGCVSLTRKRIELRLLPDLVAPTVVQSPVLLCRNSSGTFTVANPVAGVNYNWFTTATGGTAVATGVSFTTPNVVDSLVYFVGSSTSAGCVSGSRTRVVASVVADLALPVVTVDSVGPDFVLFRWTAVPSAASYQVSTNNGLTYSAPSSGSTGLTHRVTGLAPLTNVTLLVRATGIISCLQSTSAPVTGRTNTDQIYIPNAFSPNGDGLNDFLLVYGYTIRSMRMIIFSQWGEKMFESTNQNLGWNGTYKGKPQPSGVYMYVCEMILNDGTKQQRKGSINLVR